MASVNLTTPTSAVPSSLVTKPKTIHSLRNGLSLIYHSKEPDFMAVKTNLGETQSKDIKANNIAKVILYGWLMTEMPSAANCPEVCLETAKVGDSDFNAVTTNKQPVNKSAVLKSCFRVSNSKLTYQDENYSLAFNKLVSKMCTFLNAGDEKRREEGLQVKKDLQVVVKSCWDQFLSETNSQSSAKSAQPLATVTNAAANVSNTAASALTSTASSNSSSAAVPPVRNSRSLTPPVPTTSVAPSTGGARAQTPPTNTSAASVSQQPATANGTAATTPKVVTPPITKVENIKIDKARGIVDSSLGLFATGSNCSLLDFSPVSAPFEITTPHGTYEIIPGSPFGLPSSVPTPVQTSVSSQPTPQTTTSTQPSSQTAVNTQPAPQNDNEKIYKQIDDLLKQSVNFAATHAMRNNILLHPESPKKQETLLQLVSVLPPDHPEIEQFINGLSDDVVKKGLLSAIESSKKKNPQSVVSRPAESDSKGESEWAFNARTTGKPETFLKAVNGTNSTNGSPSKAASGVTGSASAKPTSAKPTSNGYSSQYPSLSALRNAISSAQSDATASTAAATPDFSLVANAINQVKEAAIKITDTNERAKAFKSLDQMIADMIDKVAIQEALNDDGHFVAPTGRNSNGQQPSGDRKQNGQARATA